MSIEIGNTITAINLEGKEVKGEVKNIMKAFGMVQLKTGEDRLDMCICSINDIKEIK